MDRLNHLIEKFGVVLFLKGSPLGWELTVRNEHGVQIYSAFGDHPNEMATAAEASIIEFLNKPKQTTAVDKVLARINKDPCPATGKSSYETSRKAEEAAAWLTMKNLHQLRTGPTSVRSYQCEHCQKWHLTSKPWFDDKELKPQNAAGAE